MSVLQSPLAGLAWLGRQGTGAIAVLVFIGIAVPAVGAVLKPYVAEAIFALLCIAFLRVDAAALRGTLRRPGVLLAATGWTMLVMPLLFVGVCLAFDLEGRFPDLYLAIMLQAVASPMMAAPAFAALMGFDATLILLTLVASTALTPLTATFYAYLFLDGTLSLSPIALGAKLLAILAGSALVAAVIRRIAGGDAVARRKDEIDGLNVLVLFVFVAAVMGGVADSFLAAPLLATAIGLLAFVITFAVLGVTLLAFLWAGRDRAFALAFMASQRNMGLMLAATGGVLPDMAWLYFAMCQFPIYLSPHLLKPLARRFGGAADS
jgi:hypothetical protein